MVKKLADSELLYPLIILNSINPKASILREDLRKLYPAHIIVWLEENDLLVSVKFKVEDRFIEARTVLGKRALNIINDDLNLQLDIIKEINNSRMNE